MWHRRDVTETFRTRIIWSWKGYRTKNMYIKIALVKIKTFNRTTKLKQWVEWSKYFLILAVSSRRNFRRPSCRLLKKLRKTAAKNLWKPTLGSKHIFNKSIILINIVIILQKITRVTNIANNLCPETLFLENQRIIKGRREVNIFSII